MKTSISVNQLLVEERPTLIRYMPPLVEQRVLAMIHAWRGVGKTHFALEMAAALCSGSPFLKWECIQPPRVLYIDTEMTKVRMADRILKIAQGSSFDFKGEMLGIVCSDMFEDNKIPDISTPKGALWLLKEAANYDVIFIDNLSGIANLTKENDEKVWNLIEPKLMALRAAGKCVIIIHHSNKSGTQTGTSKKESPLDWVIHLKRPGDYSADEGARFDILFEKNRDFYGAFAEDITARLRHDSDGKRFWEWEPKNLSTEDTIRKYRRVGMTELQIAKETGIPLFKVKSFVKQMKDEVAEDKTVIRKGGIEHTVKDEAEADELF